MIVTLKIKVEEGAITLDDDLLEDLMAENDIEDTDELTTDQKVEVATATLEDFLDSEGPEITESLTDYLGGQVAEFKLVELEIEEDEEIEIDD
ncbi:hypothetical protein SEA_GOURDTHYMES_47 [Gordonia phage GourdThymes]|uniref:Pterin-binding domain-containing protein n=11 Tax=Montyvirus TaxID=2733196 RepID=A0A2L1IVG1_9CAUD|nr:hypothetical protein BH763_gp083 [Gordonia phage Monty]YP_009300997.1 hypothetical protein BJD64_gp086 [Gordonia phage Hotorobo]YP_009795631.1 hypothetical protein HOS45_gp083 [Gordonia phage BirksAndSocks]YP_009797889.1 hypothetical protein HOS74_gp085 [Gordonia phage Flakey]YP_009837015.1 hypothetical protein HWB50_gp085 [Gordonia phage Adgers]YP_009853293.1 hypothetical protein HWC76_gp083 [Gordonia phage Jellybones]YP_009856337.1 hypothetical protein HWD07_gp083 [Gordonia phage John316